MVLVIVDFVTELLLSDSDGALRWLARFKSLLTACKFDSAVEEADGGAIATSGFC